MSLEQEVEMLKVLNEEASEDDSDSEVTFFP